MAARGWVVGQISMNSGPLQTIFNFLDIGDSSHGTSNYQTFTVPAGVTSLTIEAWGAAGGGHTSLTGAGFYGLAGKGGYIKATITVTPGEVLRVYVGGCNTSFTATSGFNGGGAGGNASVDGLGGGGGTDIRRSPYGLADRLVIAGGGGGAGGYTISGAGTTNTQGGDGGYTSGTNASFFGSTSNTSDGGGATSSAGGTAGTGGGGHAGTAGGLGVGGDAANFASGPGGGGGGGGLYGGGSGEGNVSSTTASGGGGSSACPGGTHVADTTGVCEGDGLLIVTI